MKKLDIFLFCAGLLGVLDGFLAISLHCGANLGTYLPIMVGLLFIAYAILRRTRLYRNRGILLKKLEKLAVVLFILWMISLITVVTILSLSSISDDNNASDCILLLGAGLHGEQPSLVLIERLNLALDCINSNKDLKVIVTGGKGKGEDITEAEAMKRYLVSHGVPEENIITEDKATSTMENMLFSAEIIKSRFGSDMKKVTIVTSDFHMFRAKLLARRIGLEPRGISAKTPFYIYPNVFSREYFALIKSLIFDRPL